MIVVRATDMSGWDNLALPPEIRAKVGTGPSYGSAAAGCADASLYRRVRAVGLTELQMGPQLQNFFAAPYLESASDFESGQLAALSPEEAQPWRAAGARAATEGAYLWASPVHCAVGTKR